MHEHTQTDAWCINKKVGRTIFYYFQLDVMKIKAVLRFCYLIQSNQDIYSKIKPIRLHNAGIGMHFIIKNACMHGYYYSKVITGFLSCHIKRDAMKSFCPTIVL